MSGHQPTNSNAAEAKPEGKFRVPLQAEAALRALGAFGLSWPTRQRGGYAHASLRATRKTRKREHKRDGGIDNWGQRNHGLGNIAGALRVRGGGAGSAAAAGSASSLGSDHVSTTSPCTCGSFSYAATSHFSIVLAGIAG